MSQQENKKVTELDRSAYRDLLEKIIIPTITGAVYEEALIGTTDGNNKKFSISRDAFTGTLRVYENGIRLVEDKDYTFHDKLIYFTIAPSTSARVIADYFPMDV
jgi:hypothetical protein